MSLIEDLEVSLIECEELKKREFDSNVQTCQLSYLSISSQLLPEVGVIV